MVETISPERLHQEGQSAYKRGDMLAAARVFEAAAQSYLATGDELNAAEMANNSSVAYLQAGEAEAALKAVDGSAETFAAAGDMRRQGMALGNYGAALEAVNRLEEAVQAYQQSAELLKQVGEDDLRAHVMQSLSALQLRTGRQLQALATMQAGLDGLKRPTLQQRFLKRLLGIPFRLINKS